MLYWCYLLPEIGRNFWAEPELGPPGPTSLAPV